MLLQSGPRGGLEDKCICDRDQAGIQSHSQRGAKAWCVPGAFCLHATSYSFLVLVRVASQGEPPASRELDREGKERAYLAQSRLGSNLAVLASSWAEQEPTWGQLGPNLRRTRPVGSTGVQHGATWARLDANWAECGQLGFVWGYLPRKLGPRQAQPAWSCGNPHRSKNASFQRVAFSPPGLGSAWARAACQRVQLGPTRGRTISGPTGAKLAHVELKLGRNRPRLKPCDAGGGPGYVEHGATWARLAAVSHQVKPNGDTIWGTLRNTKRHRGPKSVGNTSDNARFEDFGLGRPCPNFEAM